MKFVLTALGLGALLALANYWVLWNLGGTPGCVACAAVLLGGPFVLALALAGILPALGGSPQAAAPAAAKTVTPAAPARPVEPPEHTALRLLASLQEEGRLVDFLTEEIAGYSDEQIGAATRGIHDACAKALRACVTLEPVLPGHEDDTVTLPANFDPASVRLTGNVHGNPPFTGTLRHGGWRVKSIAIPARSGLDPKIVAPAEVEIA
jgi:Domain of unknown function (DUF2760)